MQKLEEQSQILLEHGKILRELREHNDFTDEQLEFVRENVLMRSEFREFHEEYLQAEDKTMTMLKRIDEDRLFTHGRIDRFEQKVKGLAKAVA